MQKEHEYRDFFQLQHKVINQPVSFLKELKNSKARFAALSHEEIEYLRGQALATTGAYKEASDTWECIASTAAAKSNHMIAARTYIALYNIFNFTGWSVEQRNQFLSLAEDQCRQSSSRAVKANLKIIKAMDTDSGQPLFVSEGMLREAMQDAMEENLDDLKLEIYINYTMLYMKHGLPDMANKHLLMIRELINKKDNPSFYCQMSSLQGIITSMLRDPQKGHECLQEAFTLAEKQNYINLLLPIMMNLGLCKVNLRYLQEGVLIFKKCLGLAQKCGIESSDLAYRTQDNLARVLCSCDRQDEAIEMMEANIARSEALQDFERKARLQVNLTNAMIDLEKFREAEQNITKAIEYFEQAKNHQYLLFAYRTKARLYEAMENYQEAFYALELLDQSHQINFQENFTIQSRNYQKQLELLQYDFVKIKSRCSEGSVSRDRRHNLPLIGDHPSIKAAISAALMAARYPFTNVFITGESGTGKELIARLIHTESNTGRNMVAINAAAISPNLIESELFGHKRGAFTGAIEDKKGKFELADKGSLFLDEISEMPMELQAKLLRAIETQTIQPVGSNQDIKIQCRIISSSNQSISKLIKENRYRLDLHFRLNKLEIHLLPLRERLSDLETLTSYFAKRFANEFGMKEPTINEDFYACLRQHSFPGNVRELHNIVERIFILRPKAVWGAEQLENLIEIQSEVEQPDTELYRSIEPVSIVPAPDNMGQNLKNAEHQMILEALEACNWRQKAAAKKLGISESTLCRRIKSYGIR